VVAAFYYLNVAKQMWFMPAPDGDESPVPVPATLLAALALTVGVTIGTGVTGVVPDITDVTGALGGP
jgi:NADH:ubiquinone oxidoreductase subunit 2 (subunit N)